MANGHTLISIISKHCQSPNDNRPEIGLDETMILTMRIFIKEDKKSCCGMVDLEDFSQFLIMLAGSPGTGKSTFINILSAVFAKLLDSNKSVLVTGTTNMVAGSFGAITTYSLLDLLFEGKEERGFLKKRLKAVRILIIDEC